MAAVLLVHTLYTETRQAGQGANCAEYWLLQGQQAVVGFAVVRQSDRLDYAELLQQWWRHMHAEWPGGVTGGEKCICNTCRVLTPAAPERPLQSDNLPTAAAALDYNTSGHTA